MTNLRDETRCGPPLRVSWATDEVHMIALNSFAEAWVAIATVQEYHGTPVRCRVMVGREAADSGFVDWRAEDGRKLTEHSLAECRDLDWAWAQRVARENVAQVEGAAV